MDMAPGSGTVGVVGVVTFTLSIPSVKAVVNTRLSKVPAKDRTPSPFGKLPGGTEELKVDEPTSVEPKKACKVRVPAGRLPVAKFKKMLVTLLEKATLTGPNWPGVQTPWIKALPDKVARPRPAVLQTEAGPEKVADRPFTVEVIGATVPEATVSKLKTASA